MIEIQVSGLMLGMIIGVIMGGGTAFYAMWKENGMKLIDAPVGVFAYHDELVLKTEYTVDIDGVYIPDCYILSSGEKFWGGMKSTEDFKTKYNNLDVEVIDILKIQPDKLPSTQPTLKGWICPVCGRGLSPFTMICPCRNGKGWEIT